MLSILASMCQRVFVFCNYFVVVVMGWGGYWRVAERLLTAPVSLPIIRHFLECMSAKTLGFSYSSNSYLGIAGEVASSKWVSR